MRTSSITGCRITPDGYIGRWRNLSNHAGSPGEIAKLNWQPAVCGNKARGCSPSNVRVRESITSRAECSPEPAVSLLALGQRSKELWLLVPVHQVGYRA